MPCVTHYGIHTHDFFFQKEVKCFGDTFTMSIFFHTIKIINLRGDLTDILADTVTLFTLLNKTSYLQYIVPNKSSLTSLACPVIHCSQIMCSLVLSFSLESQVFQGLPTRSCDVFVVVSYACMDIILRH